MYAKQAEIGKGSEAWWRRMQERLLGAARDALTAAEREAAEKNGSAAGFGRIVEELLAHEAMG